MSLLVFYVSFYGYIGIYILTITLLTTLNLDVPMWMAVGISPCFVSPINIRPDLSR